jgi:CTP:molybdopterin cytidylyltransferase MocA
MTSGHVAAIILAAGLSERMGEFKPLLSLGGMTILERCVAIFREEGIGDVRVVTGHRGAELEPLLERLGVQTVTNPGYTEGMFSSVRAGVDSLGVEVDAFFVLPVDVSLVRSATIRRLLSFHKQGQGADVIYPRFRGIRGHPPLIAAVHAREIAAWQGGGGLKAALDQWESTALDLDVADGNILLDMDTPEDYLSLREKSVSLQIPTAEECRELLEKVRRVGEEIIRHGEAVARVATRLGRELNLAGDHLDISLLRAAGLLHDIAKGEPGHAAAGARILHEHGFGEVAGAVATHMELTIPDGEGISAGEVIYLADKLVQGECLLPLEERFRKKMERHAGAPGILDNISERLQTARKIQGRIESRLGRTLEVALSG